MRYDKLIEELESRSGKSIYSGAQRMNYLMEKLDFPQQGPFYFHIAGTNGKGSVANYLKDALKEKYRVGFFTSPHLVSYCERIRIGDEPITEDDFVRLGQRIYQAEEKTKEKYGPLSLFEFITAIGFLYFKEKDCKYVVMEVGMGGRFDSTNVILPEDKLISIITSISFDHMEYLGKTLSEIAYQKAGIISSKGLAVTSNKNREVLKVLEEECRLQGAALYKTEDLTVKILKATLEGTVFEIELKEKHLFHLSQLGTYQVENATLAFYSLYLLIQKGLLDLTVEEIIQSFQNSQWPGRMELISQDPKILLDGAHNLAGIEELFHALESFQFNKLYVILSILSDKEHQRMMEVISYFTKEVSIVELQNKRGSQGELLEKEGRIYGLKTKVQTLEEALKDLVEKTSAKDLILITGSLYFVSEARKLLMKHHLKIE
ncbi:MAG: folylpolyglutamate synthase/dihydrofolate synthase family protein [Tissierellia bacterium]|nr:folylpolyglutamate synthase/dihydrofolate synthase family protein [Tissierellia bacterium]